MDNVNLGIQEVAVEPMTAVVQAQLPQLSELQLALVGGGCGETVFD